MGTNKPNQESKHKYNQNGEYGYQNQFHLLVLKKRLDYRFSLSFSQRPNQTPNRDK